MKKSYWIFILIAAVVIGIGGCSWIKESGVFYEFVSFDKYKQGAVVNAPSVIPEAEAFEKTDEPMVHFFAVGCAGAGNGGQKYLAESMGALAPKAAPDFVLYLGDNFYGRGVSSVDDPQWKTKFEDIYKPEVLPMPFYAVLGNHDYHINPEAQVAYSAKSERWRMPARYYSFERVLPDGTKAEFFGLDTMALLKGKGEDQLKWLEEKLNASKAAWKIVYGHHPVYSDARYKKQIEKLRKMIEPLFIAHKVDLYLSAHNHSIEVFKKQAGGVVYVVSGAGSRPRDVNWSEQTAFAHADIGFAWIRLTKDTMGLSILGKEGRFLYNEEIPKNNAPVDSLKAA